ncbi:PilZ domain-containing protein [Hyalangium gracile]|uniref:PilZ domain-containing protein n=1 Tax=Hyalangium gracile TaxID=394092 RepID=UPI001CCE49D1|nr:PilZ domain-containing protein [Hyalangium gracile]
MSPHLGAHAFIEEPRTQPDPRGTTVPDEARGTPRVQEELVEPERIQLALMTAVSLGGRGLLRRGGRATRLVLEQVDLKARSLHWRCAAPAERGGTFPCEAEVAGYNSVYRLRLQEGTWEEERLRTPLPERLVRVRHRQHRRVPPPPATRLHLPLPTWPGREREVLDVSFGGLGVRLLPGEWLEPGRVLPSSVLVTEDGQPIRLRAEVRHVSATPEGTNVCGLRVEPLTELDTERWRELVTGSLCPATRTDGSWVEPLWQLFIDSGYFSLASHSAEAFEDQRTSFLELGKRAASLPHLMCLTAWPSTRGVEGTLASMKPYRSMWLVHQLAKRPGSPPRPGSTGEVLRDLYVRTVEHAQSDPGFRWLGAYIEGTVPFVHRAHAGFARRMEGTGRTLLLPLRMVDVSCAAPGRALSEGLSVGPATPGELTLLASELARIRPASYIEALDLSLESLDLGAATGAWREARLERERHILVARHGGRPLAAAVLEVGQRGSNPFRLLDAMRLFPLAPEEPEARQALLDAARGWYASRGRDTFVLMQEDGLDSHASEASPADAHGGAQPYLWLISAELVPEFLEHIHTQTAGRLPTPPEKEQS